jgi:hypothetical protein
VPEIVTGGPEAIHQLAHTINAHGGYARILYMNAKHRLTASEAVGEPPFASIMYQAYKQYEPRPVSMEQLTEDTIVIFPEIWIDKCYSLSQATQAKCACWWLSVDNAETGSQFSDPNVRVRFFKTVFQLAQSDYAVNFLRSAGAQDIYKITDYTSQQFTVRGNFEQLCEWPIKRLPRSVTYLPKKGKSLALAFQKRAQEMSSSIVFRPIENMTKSQVIDLLVSTEIYIDFGHQPGKDRVPREATALGCVVLLNKVGAGTSFADHPLPAVYKFSEQDIESGDLVKRVEEIFDKIDDHLLEQSYYRSAIFSEKAEFERLARCFFFH